MNLKDSDIKKSEIETQDLRKKLEELQSKLTNSNEMISYLNNQLNETPKSNFLASNNITQNKSALFTPTIPKTTFNNTTLTSEYKYTSIHNNNTPKLPTTNFGISSSYNTHQYNTSKSPNSTVASNKNYLNEGVSPFKEKESYISDPYKEFREKEMMFGESNMDFGRQSSIKRQSDFNRKDDVKSANCFNGYDTGEMDDEMMPRNYKRNNIQKVIFENHE